MTSADFSRQPSGSTARRPETAWLSGWLRAAVPGLLFSLRLWAAVCLALYVAFWLQLEIPQWAGSSAAIVCQPRLGATLRKSSFRIIGTVTGAVMIVVLTALFPQHRVGFFLGLALWGAACGFAASILHNFASYGAALAGYTAFIIAADVLGATGGASDEVFLLAVNRVSEICVGIVCAGIVLAGTDLGNAARRLAPQLAAIAADISMQLALTIAQPGQDLVARRSVGRALLARIIALDPVVDEAIGESSGLRYRAGALQAAMDGLFAMLSGWRTIADCLEQLPDEQRRREAKLILDSIPRQLHETASEGGAAAWADDPLSLHRLSRAGVRSLTTLPARSASLQLMADTLAGVMLALQRVFDALALLGGHSRGLLSAPHTGGIHVPDLLPAWINAVRVFVTVAALQVFWVVTAWPSGGLAMLFGAIAVILMSPRGDRAASATRTLLLGICISAVVAAIVTFAVLPVMRGFVGLSLALGLVLLPLGTLSTHPRLGPMLLTMSVYSIVLVAPANPMTYNPPQFYNNLLAMVAGVIVAILAFTLIPPLSPEQTVRRMLSLTLRDLRRIATGEASPKAKDWERRIYARLRVLPAAAKPLQLSHMVTALAVGLEVIRLRRTARRLGLQPDVDVALHALGMGDCDGAIRWLAALDRKLVTYAAEEPDGSIRFRARGGVRHISDALARHADFFCGAITG